jgi:alkanesulfonate monooxygenase SsuD/methylene tetrahydromethanopterin reductase-like flavin-dependent oxidoreductase (luciferase family)
LLDGKVGAKVRWNGAHIAFGEIELDPKPIQRPFPIYVPGKTSDAFARIARFGLGMMVQAAIAHDRVEGLKPVLAQHRRDISTIDVVAEGQLRLARTQQQAIADYRASRQGQFSLSRDAKLEKLVGDNWIGTPDAVSAKMRVVAAQGITHFNVLHVSGDTMPVRINQMQMFAEEVMAHLAH